MPPRRFRVASFAGAALFVLTACGPTAAIQSTSTPVATTVLTSQTTVAKSVTVAASSPTPRHSSAVQSTASSSAPRSRATSPVSALVSAAVYFTAGGRLVVETAAVPAATPARGSIAALLAGPKTTGHYSQVPTGTRLLGLNVAAGTATVNLSSEVQTLQGSPAIPLFLGQLVNTLTQFPDVQHVVLEINGQPVRSLGGEGAAVPEPLDRAMVQGMLAATTQP